MRLLLLSPLLLLSVILVTICQAERTVPTPRYVVNLDQDPQYRWTHIVSDYKKEFQGLLKQLKKMVGPELVALASVTGDNAIQYIPYPYNLEIVGVALAGDVTLGETLLGNLLYEATAYNSSRPLWGKACTSIVAEADNGTVYHGRNLDYSIANYLRNMTITVDFQSSGKTLYTGTTFVGYVGVLTGQRPHAYTVSLDQRDKGEWWMNVLDALVGGTHAITGFLIRDTLGDASLSFSDAILRLAYQPLIAPCYLIVGGVKSNEGAVITRDRTGALDIWRLEAFKERWFLVETNYDHWGPPPPSDDRRDPAIKAVDETGRGNVSAPSLFHVLSLPPVLNNKTAFTVTMSASIPELYSAWIRYP